jgi:hypothetical protein
MRQDVRVTAGDRGRKSKWFKNVRSPLNRIDMRSDAENHEVAVSCLLQPRLDRVREQMSEMESIQEDRTRGVVNRFWVTPFHGSGRARMAAGRHGHLNLGISRSSRIGVTSIRQNETT